MKNLQADILEDILEGKKDVAQLENIQEERLVLEEINEGHIALEEIREEKIVLEDLKVDINALVEQVSEGNKPKVSALENKIGNQIELLGDKIDEQRIALEDKVENYFMNSNMTVTVVGALNMVSNYSEAVLERTIEHGMVHYNVISDDGMLSLEKDDVVSIKEIKYILGDRVYLFALKNGITLQYSKA